MQTEDIKITSRSNASQRIIALGIVVAFLYWTSSVVMTLLLAVLLAYFLDPFAGILEKVRLPRALGALFVLPAVTSTGVNPRAAGWAREGADECPRLEDFFQRLPRLVEPEGF